MHEAHDLMRQGKLKAKTSRSLRPARGEASISKHTWATCRTRKVRTYHYFSRRLDCSVHRTYFQSRLVIESCCCFGWLDAHFCSCLVSVLVSIIFVFSVYRRHQHTTKSASSLQEEAAHLPAATAASTPKHADNGRRLRSHPVRLVMLQDSRLRRLSNKSRLVMSVFSQSGARVL